MYYAAVLQQQGKLEEAGRLYLELIESRHARSPPLQRKQIPANQNEAGEYAYTSHHGHGEDHTE